ncbi:unnamed protein product [Effrenium voratum]|uniref:Magnesium-dependent phosphatase 1 n=1 Tax=Effrenium voratum TaxID=2562239 RepID=A0AA36JHB1_9DINO|nr:unnamed protein product [Effrenium voratum]CAJ1444809.1 unnamed protein product [Effrenium voratum]
MLPALQPWAGLGPSGRAGVPTRASQTDQRWRVPFFTSTASLLACSASRAQGLGRAQARARVCCAAKGRRRGSSVSPASGALPRCVVFDLDGCIWSPEMYELSWDRGGSPFRYDEKGVMRDRNGCAILLHSGVDRALTEMASETKWQDTQVAVASCCDVPPWAFELLGKFEFGPSRAKLSQVISTAQIHKGSKQGHLREIRDTVGCDFDDMIFFDNEPYNCDQVARLSVTCVYCPEGVTTEAWTAGIEAFPVPGSTIRC